MPNDIPFTSVGAVSQRLPLQGSFCNVRIECDNGDSGVFTVNLDQDLKFPAVGERIKVTGIIRNDRHLTKFWERVA